MKQKYLELLKTKIPYCKLCGKLFELGFPTSEAGIADYLICTEYDLICHCENYRKIVELFSNKKDNSIDISPFYIKI